MPVPFPGTPQLTDLDILYGKSASADGILTEQDIADLKDFHADMDAVCQRAHERGVKLIIDAEYSWYQVSSHHSRLVCADDLSAS